MLLRTIISTRNGRDKQEEHYNYLTGSALGLPVRRRAVRFGDKQEEHYNWKFLGYHRLGDIDKQEEHYNPSEPPPDRLVEFARLFDKQEEHYNSGSGWVAVQGAYEVYDADKQEEHYNLLHESALWVLEQQLAQIDKQEEHYNFDSTYGEGRFYAAMPRPTNKKNTTTIKFISSGYGAEGA